MVNTFRGSNGTVDEGSGEEEEEEEEEEEVPPLNVGCCHNSTFPSTRPAAIKSRCGWKSISKIMEED